MVDVQATSNTMQVLIRSVLVKDLNKDQRFPCIMEGH